MLLKDFTVTEHKNILDIYNSVCLVNITKWDA